MVLDAIDENLAELKKAHRKPLLIRLGEDVQAQFVQEMTDRGEPIAFDGSPVFYKDIPVSPGAINPEGVTIESEPAP